MFLNTVEYTVRWSYSHNPTGFMRGEKEEGHDGEIKGQEKSRGEGVFGGRKHITALESEKQKVKEDG